MMIRVKLVIIRRIDGSTVSRLISSRICSESDKGWPLPATVCSARSSAPGWPPTGGAGAGTGTAGAAAWAMSGTRMIKAARAISPALSRAGRPNSPETALLVRAPKAVLRIGRVHGGGLGNDADPGPGDREEQALAREIDHGELA